jgi:cobalt-zinc-cadmium efflux system outer membrane protein
MRRILLPLLAAVLGCRAYPVDAPPRIEGLVAAVASAGALPAPSADTLYLPLPTAAPAPASLPGPPDLPTLWSLALAHNPSLREAAAEVEVARGRSVQAAQYPNPRLAYSQENLGTSPNAAGAVKFEITQEIVTGGKRGLDVAIASGAADEAGLASLGRKFDVLTRVRRAYYEYLGALDAVRVNEETVASLDQGLRITRQQVEVIKTRPRTDLLRIDALLEEARIRLAGSRVNLEAAWQQLASEVGVARLAPPPTPGSYPPGIPAWDPPAVVRRVQETNTELKRAGLDVRRAHLEIERARAEVIPNVTVGGGYSRDFAENLQGAILSADVPLPLWDRKQGRIHEAEAHLVQAQAAVQSTAARLGRETTAALARYQAARQQVERMTTLVVPRLQESVDLLRRSYQAGAAQTTFADVLSAEQALDAARLTLAERRQAVWLAVADLQGLMQLDLDGDLPPPAGPPH